MERVVSVVETFFKPRDNYTTGARTWAFFLAALVAFGLGFLPDGGNPWVIGLFLAGFLNLFAYIANNRRIRDQKELLLLEETREQLEKLVTSLESYIYGGSSTTNQPDAIAAVHISLARAMPLLDTLNMPTLPAFEGRTVEALTPLQVAVALRISECQRRITGWEKPRGWWKSAGSFSLRS